MKQPHTEASIQVGMPACFLTAWCSCSQASSLVQDCVLRGLHLKPNHSSPGHSPC